MISNYILIYSEKLVKYIIYKEFIGWLGGTKVDGEYALQSISEMGQTTILELIANYGADYLKKEATGLVGEVTIDAGLSFIPGISGAIQAYKRKQIESNMEKTIEQITHRMDEIENNLASKSYECNETINKLFGYVLDFIQDEPQVDKIEYFINGFVNLTKHESITDDFVLTYYDLMKDLRMVDLAVLRLYCNPHDENSNWNSFENVMEYYGLTIDQYDSVRNNLFRLGLLTTIKDKESMNDLDTLFESVKTIQKYLDKKEKGKTEKTTQVERTKNEV